MRPVRRRQGSARRPAAEGTLQTPPPSRAPSKPRWRETLDSYGGFWTLGIIGIAVLFVGVLIFTNAGGTDASGDPLMGEEIVSPGPADHVTGDSQLLIPDGRPPVNGPHFATPQAPGVFDAPIPDGNAIHSLEHGIIWITYDPEQVDDAVISDLRELQSDNRRDVIVSPRPANAEPIAAASWGRLLQQDSLDIGELERFIATNRNRSPEPGVR
jgi:hypothetical protein